MMDRPPTPGGSTTVYDNKRGSQHFTVTKTSDFDQVTAQADIHKQANKEEEKRKTRKTIDRQGLNLDNLSIVHNTFKGF